MRAYLSIFSTAIAFAVVIVGTYLLECYERWSARHLRNHPAWFKMDQADEEND